jgi:hypothetical protein
VRNSFVILFSVDVSTAELAPIRRKATERAMTGPQTYLAKSLLDFIIAPFRPSSDKRSDSRHEQISLVVDNGGSPSAVL